MARTLTVAVFASGNGRTSRRSPTARGTGGSTPSIELLVCDKPRRYVVERAEAAGIETFVFRPQDYPSREAYETRNSGRAEAPRHRAGRAGRLYADRDAVLVDAYYGRMINVHPSLLPAFPGVNAHRPGARIRREGDRRHRAFRRRRSWIPGRSSPRRRWRWSRATPRKRWRRASIRSSTGCCPRSCAVRGRPHPAERPASDDRILSVRGGRKPAADGTAASRACRHDKGGPERSNTAGTAPCRSRGTTFRTASGRWTAHVTE